MHTKITKTVAVRINSCPIQKWELNKIIEDDIPLEMFNSNIWLQNDKSSSTNTPILDLNTYKFIKQHDQEMFAEVIKDSSHDEPGPFESIK